VIGGGYPRGISDFVVFYDMDQLEFYNSYKQYSTADLINIVREKDNYQAVAVLAAEQLLREREVSFGDREEADRDFEEKAAKRMAATAKVDSYKATVADWVQPLARPSRELQPEKWFRIFLVVYGFYYARGLYYILRYLIRASSMGLDISDFVLNGTVIALDTLFFVLIIQKRKWGWILLVVEHTYMIFINLIPFVAMFRFKRIHVNAMPNLYTAFFHFAMVAFLWRPVMAGFFGVQPVVKKRSLAVGLGLGVVFACISWLQYTWVVDLHG
jgi:hypothetical protein